MIITISDPIDNDEIEVKDSFD